MIPVILRLGPVTIYSYGLMMALGFIVGDLLLSHECRRRELNPELGTAIIVWGAIGGLGGARLYDVFDNWSAYMSHPASIIFSGAGFVWYGGLFGGIVSTWLVARFGNRVKTIRNWPWAAPRFLVHMKWKYHSLSGSAIKAVCLSDWPRRPRSHSSLNSRGVW